MINLKNGFIQYSNYFGIQKNLQSKVDIVSDASSSELFLTVSAAILLEDDLSSYRMEISLKSCILQFVESCDSFLGKMQLLTLNGRF